MSSQKQTLSLGPLYYLWSPEKWRDFYYRIADEAPVDCVSLGESICSKRLHFTEKMVDQVADRLKRAGKQVIFSTLAMVTLERERKDVSNVIARENEWIEANDLCAIHLLAGREHVVGPLINVYNAPTARFLASRGAKVICLPPELPMASVNHIVNEVGDAAAIEVFAFGRLPLAISARCAHARSKGHVKDNCQFVCGEDPNGLAIRTIDGKDFLNLNGIQTMSHSCCALYNEIEELQAAGIQRFRLSPQDCDMVRVAEIFDALINDGLPAQEAAYSLRNVCGDMPLSNGFIHGVEGARLVERVLP